MISEEEEHDKYQYINSNIENIKYKESIRIRDNCFLTFLTFLHDMVHLEVWRKALLPS